MSWPNMRIPTDLPASYSLSWYKYMSFALIMEYLLRCVKLNLFYFKVRWLLSQEPKQKKISKVDLHSKQSINIKHQFNGSFEEHLNLKTNLVIILKAGVKSGDSRSRVRWISWAGGDFWSTIYTIPYPSNGAHVWVSAVKREMKPVSISWKISTIPHNGVNYFCTTNTVLSFSLPLPLHLPN